MDLSKLKIFFSSGSAYEGIVITDPANVGYLTQVFFPFPERKENLNIALIAGRKDRILVVPAVWKQAAEQQGVTALISYDFNEKDPVHAYVDAVIAAVSAAGLIGGKIGTDIDGMPCNIYSEFTALINKHDLVFCGKVLQSAREIKKADEIEKIRMAAIIADRGIIGALNHAEGTVGYAGYTLSEFLERIRIHAAEFKSYGIGELNVSMGRAGKSYYTPVLDFKKLEAGNIIRVDLTNSWEGYWVSISRMLYAGTPSKDEERNFEKNYELKCYAAGLLKAGICVDELCKSVAAYAACHDIDFCAEFGCGHGVGVEAVEPPFLYAENNDKLVAGMVIALDVYTRACGRELIHSIDIYEITENGANKLSNFRDWDEYYTIDGCRNTH